MTVEGLKQFIAAQVGVFFSFSESPLIIFTSFCEASVNILVTVRFLLLQHCYLDVYCFNNGSSSE